jgi:hypothetical protein
VATTSETETRSEELITPFSEYWTKTLVNLKDFEVATKETNITSLEKLYEIVTEALCAHQDVLIGSLNFKKPTKKDFEPLTKKLISIITRAVDLGKNDRNISLHCDAVKNGLDILFWLFIDAQCEDTAKIYYESIDFAANKIMMKKNPPETTWIKSYKNVIKEIYNLVKTNYKMGLNWNMKGDSDYNKLYETIGNTYKKIILKENVEEAKPVEKSAEKLEEKPIVKPIEKTEVKETKSVEVKKNHLKRGRKNSLLKKGKSEKFEEGKNRIIFENLEDESKELDLEKLQLNTIVDINNCLNTTFTIAKKVKLIKLTNCENVNIICESLISIFEIINCVGIKVQVNNTVKAFSIDGSDNVLLFLNENSKEAQVIASKSNDMRIRLLKENDQCDYDDLILPEQFVYKITPNRKIEGKISDNYGY